MVFVLESSFFYFEIWPHPCVPLRSCLSQTVPEFPQFGFSWTRFQFVAHLTPESFKYSCTSATVPHFLVWTLLKTPSQPRPCFHLRVLSLVFDRYINKHAREADY